MRHRDFPFNLTANRDSSRFWLFRSSQRVSTAVVSIENPPMLLHFYDRV
jgi:hypothetical protein